MLQIVRNRTWAFDATIFDTYVAEGDPGNVPTNHTGWSIRSQIRTRVGNKLVANLNVTFPVPTAGTIAIRHEREFTRSLSPGDYWWDIVATDPAGYDHVYVEPEPIAVRDNPTDPANATYDFVPGGGGAVMHTHVISDVTGLQAALNNKAPLTHTHSIADVTGLQAVLDGKAPLAHTHTIADVLGLQTILNDLSEGGGGSTTYAGLTDAATVDLPAINGPLGSALAGKLSTTGTAADVNPAGTSIAAALAGKETAGAAAAAQAYSIKRANHTGTQAQSTIVNLVSDLSGKASLAANNTFTGQQAFTDATTWSYTSAAAAAHRIALGAGTTGAELFQAATAEAARTTLMGEIIKYDPNAAAPRTNPTFADDDVLAGINLTPGLWEISFYFAHDAGTCGVQARLRFGTPANVDSPGSQNYGFVFRGNQALQALFYVLATGTFTAGAATTSVTNWHHTGQVTVNVTGNTTLAMQYQYGTSVAGQTITRRAGAFLRARKIA